jgi:hypothetical protein
MDPGELEKARGDEPIVVELREFDLGSEEGINDLCNLFLEPSRRGGRGLFRRRRKPVADASDDRLAALLRREALTVGRNDRCPCGSGHKYKRCCGR